MSSRSQPTTYPEIPASKNLEKPSKKVRDLIPRNLAQELGAFVFAISDNTIHVGAVNPNSEALSAYLQGQLADRKINLYQCSKKELEQHLKYYERDYMSEVEHLIDEGLHENGNIATLVETLLFYAIEEKASDIHIEPEKHKTSVRFRIDGVLRNMFTVPRNAHEAIVARFKIMADLKIDEYRRPQDGRVEVEGLDDKSLRISTVPTLFGEKIALRVLDETSNQLDLNTLGFTEKQKEVLRRNIDKPFGMIVASGPTGSGKTTTLYALLHMLEKEGINISTLEDPIESHIEGVNQIQINPRVGLNFASGLRTLLRQDPDIIMVGEIRDSETVIMAANAAMTGHLVFTTLHTNDAPSAFIRFLEMKVEDFVVASMVNIVVAQRLVRKVCEKCKVKEPLNAPVIEKIRERKDILDALKKVDPDTVDNLEKTAFVKGEGCSHCYDTGYAGRLGIFELLELNKNIHDLILQHPTADDIREKAMESGFEDMITDAVGKVLQEKTTFEEVLRTTKTN